MNISRYHHRVLSFRKFQAPILIAGLLGLSGCSQTQIGGRGAQGNQAFVQTGLAAGEERARPAAGPPVLSDPDQWLEAGVEKPASITRLPDPAAVKVPDGYKVEVFAKGLNYPTDITFAPDGTAYVSEAGGHFYGTRPSQSPTPRILKITPDGEIDVLFAEAIPDQTIVNADRIEDIPEGLIGPIEGVTYNRNNGLIYVAHRSRVSVLNPETKEFKTLISDLPAWGIFHNTKVTFDQQGKMIFSVSAQGNSGLVDAAIMKVIAFYNKPQVREIPGEDVILTGVNYPVKNMFSDKKGDKLETGAFVPYGVTTKPGQVIKGEFWCNSGIYRVNPDGTNPERIAWGMRNPFHLEVTRDGRLLCSNNSGNPIPGRPVYDDWETIYEVKQGEWYGWPDYFSSVPITDDRFKAPNDPQFKKQPFPHQFVLDESTRARLLKGKDAPPPPLVKLPPHLAAQGFKIGRPEFGISEDEILLAEFGSVIPYLANDAPGFHVSRVNLKTGERQPFMTNKRGKVDSVDKDLNSQNQGVERPVRLEYGPDGALYVVDFGIIDIAQPPPKRQAFDNTGVVWKVSKQEEFLGQRVTTRQ